MLNTFPTLLAYGFFVPMFLRVAVAIFFAYQAVHHFKNKKAVASELSQKVTFVGHEVAVWAVGLLILGELALAVLLFVGAWTQIASLFAILGCMKLAFFKRTFPAYAPFARSTYILLVVVSVSLLFTGAGAFAFDLPL